MEAPGADPLIGQHINEYEVLEAVAAGGMGVVYRGVHPVIAKRVAIKVLKAEEQKEDDWQALVKEAQAANAIGHRNIVDIFGIGRLPDTRPYIIMEYLEGQTLDDRIGAGNISVLEAVQLLFDLCAPLSAAHKAGVIHRDLKPSNVFLCKQPDGGTFLKVLDFGLAKRSMSLDGVTEQTSRATVAGTPDFMAPEQAQGKAVSPRTDLYAMGCIGFVMATGKVPFSAPTPFDVMVAHVRAPVPRASSLSPALPPELDELLFKLMAKKQEERPQSADEVRDALFPLLERLGADAPAKQGPRPSVSGEFVVMKARASGQRAAEKAASAETDDALPAAPPAPGPAAEPQTDDALAPVERRSTTPLIVALAIAGAALVALLLIIPRGGPKSDAPVSPPPEAVLEKKVEPAEKPVEKPEAIKPPPEVPVTAPIPDEPPEDLTPLPTVSGPKRDKYVPSEQELRKRIASLEARLKKATPSGASPDPAALQLLAKYRVASTMADTLPARAKLVRQLDQWEHLFLAR